MAFQEACNPVALLCGNLRQALVGSFEIAAQNSCLILDNSKRKTIGVDTELFVAQVDVVVGWKVTQKEKRTAWRKLVSQASRRRDPTIHSRVKVSDGLSLTADQIVETVVLSRVDQAVANPFGRGDDFGNFSDDIEGFLDTLVADVFASINGILESVTVEAEDVERVLCCDGDERAGPRPEYLEGTFSDETPNKRDEEAGREHTLRASTSILRTSSPDSQS